MKYFVIGGILFVIDALSKILAKIFLVKTYEESSNGIPIISEIFTLKLTFNEGIAFSFPIPKFLQILFTLAFLIYFFIWAKEYFSYLSSGEKYGSTFLVSGAIGNFWERVLFGKVTDFLSFSFNNIPYIGDFSFPIFNFADIYIFLGVCLWLWGSTKSKK